jgi:hypothetical protein
LFTAAVPRRILDSEVVPFATTACAARVDPTDLVISLAQRLAKYGGAERTARFPALCKCEHFGEMILEPSSCVDEQRGVEHRWFSDAVFRVVAAFLRDDAGRLVAEFEATELCELTQTTRRQNANGETAPPEPVDYRIASAHYRNSSRETDILCIRLQ